MHALPDVANPDIRIRCRGYLPKRPGLEMPGSRPIRSIVFMQDRPGSRSAFRSQAWQSVVWPVRSHDSLPYGGHAITPTPEGPLVDRVAFESLNLSRHGRLILVNEHGRDSWLNFQRVQIKEAPVGSSDFR